MDFNLDLDKINSIEPNPDPSLKKVQPKPNQKHQQSRMTVEQGEVNQGQTHEDVVVTEEDFRNIFSNDPVDYRPQHRPHRPLTETYNPNAKIPTPQDYMNVPTEPNWQLSGERKEQFDQLLGTIQQLGLDVPNVTNQLDMAKLIFNTAVHLLENPSKWIPKEKQAIANAPQFKASTSSIGTALKGFIKFTDKL